MPPRKKKTTAVGLVDLTGSSPEPEPTLKRARAAKKVSVVVQDEEDADLAIARALQEEENAAVGAMQEDEVVVLEVSVRAGLDGCWARCCSQLLDSSCLQQGELFRNPL